MAGETVDDVPELVKALDDAYCRALKRGGIAFFRARPEWATLTAPENHAALVAHVEKVGLGKMNHAAREFFQAALADSEARLPDEWILSLNGKDLAILKDREQGDQFWHCYCVVPLAPEHVSVLTGTTVWDSGRFRYRHRVTGRIARATGLPLLPDDMRAVMRGLY